MQDEVFMTGFFYNVPTYKFQLSLELKQHKTYCSQFAVRYMRSSRTNELADSEIHIYEQCCCQCTKFAFRTTHVTS